MENHMNQRGIHNFMSNSFKPTGIISKGYLTRFILLVICIFLFGITISTLYLYLDIYRPLNTHYSAILSILTEIKESLIINTIKINAFFYLMIFLGIVILGIIYTHRIAGPLHRIKIQVKSISEGRLDTNIKFRRKDAIHQFAESLNELTKTYNNNVSMLISETQRLKETLTELKSQTEKGEDTEIALEKVFDVDSRIKKLIDSIKL
jgi:methyl-accepting chemotaxis protein